MSTSKIEKNIVDAFSNIQKPNCDELVNHTCKDCESIRNDFGSFTWQEVPAEIIHNNYENLPLFTAEGFQYYLPAYIKRVLQLDDPEDQLTMYTVFSLYNKDNIEKQKWYRARMEKFSKDQAEAIVMFLDYVINNPRYEYHHEDARWAFEQWTTYIGEFT